jgi:hypothetical protein
MTIRLYFDEDANDTELLEALRLRGIDAISVASSGMGGRDDEQQLTWATGQGRVLYSFNRGDFCRIHSEWMRAGRAHSGLIIGFQQRYTVGEQMRRLLRLHNEVTAEQMLNRLEFLSAWSLVP